MTKFSNRGGWTGVVLAAPLFVCMSAFAQPEAPSGERSGVSTNPAETYRLLSSMGVRSPVVVKPGALEDAVLIDTGERVGITTSTRWGLVCGSDARRLTAADLERMAASHEVEFAGRMFENGGAGSGGFTPRVGPIVINYQLGGSVPAAAVPAFTLAKTYLESKFRDAITVTVTVSFAALPSGVIGATGSNYVNNVTYTQSRNSLQNGWDSNDTIQAFLPTGSTVPVKYDGAGGAVTNETFVQWTRAAYKSTVGTPSGGAADAQMQYNNTFAFDFDPSNGVASNALSLVDTIIHETLHAMGFTSGADFNPEATNVLDLFRFQNSANNPATTAQFQTFARLVTFDGGSDDMVCDVIGGQWRMSDGNPWQASHFSFVGGNPSASLGIMQPALWNGATYYPNYLKASDLAMMDAIGYDDVDLCRSPLITAHPTGATRDVGGLVGFSVTATGTGLTYLWQKDGVDLTSASGYLGYATRSLSITNIEAGDAGAYRCVVTGSCGTAVSNPATLTVNTPGCPADLDDGTGTGTPDGGVTVDDLVFFVGKFADGDVGADLDDGSGTGTPDGGVTVDDLVFFVTRFAGGC